MMVISVVTYYYQKKISEAKDTILEHQRILTAQSRQAVMGEMISVIAYQWRQPLSTITLQISTLQMKKLLNKEIEEKSVDDTLRQINDTVLYLSEMVDDFKTYFQPNKELI